MDTRRNALDTAMIKLAQAQSYLERQTPTKKDFEQARDHAKDGLDLIKACLVALDHDCFEIMDRPPVKPEPGPSLFQPDGQPAQDVEIVSVVETGLRTLAPAPDEFEPFPADESADFQSSRFRLYLQTLEEVFCDVETAAGRDDYQAQLKAFRPHRSAWGEAWAKDSEAAWTQLHRTIAAATALPAGETLAAWS